ncbi:hypothetical protein FRB90_010861 [Tulasnella sp. 427]|nr:hypothetical protein FRB90_010861 [Tulasnella sp. 427]
MAFASNASASASADKFKPGNPASFQAFPSRRSVVYGTKGVVACSQPLAAEAGLEILRKGGNAADAAVAVSAALNVTEPSCCGIGGDAFCLFYDAKTKKITALNGSGRSPQALTIEHVRAQGIRGGAIPLTNLNSVTVPGAAAAWFDTVEKIGSGKVSLQDVLEPAIRLAEEGPGEIMRFPDLAETFKLLASKGKDGFYKGRVAEAIVELIKSRGGVMELSDLANHESTFVDPISYTYQRGGDVTIWECPPNGQGITALMALGILDVLQAEGKIKSLESMEHNSVEYLHVLVEALRFVLAIAFADTRYYVTDPGVEHVPVRELLSKEYLSKRAQLFDSTQANPEIHHGYPAQSSDTVYFCATDVDGNACSFIQSNYAGFGTGAIPKGCGFTLQNRGTGFSLDPSHPNALKPGKRPYHTIIPAMATRGNELFLTYGVMGGFMQPQGHVQVLLNILRGYTIQAALDAPRFCISAGLPDNEVPKGEAQKAGDINSEVYFEEGIEESIVKTLREMGHDARSVTGVQRAMMGRGQVIQKLSVDTHTNRTVWAAGSDPRADGHAVAQI